MDDHLTIAGETIASRLIMGTGGSPSLGALEQALRASGTRLTTVALRRLDPAATGSVLDVLGRLGIRLLPNTAGCFTARDAVLTARLAREAFATTWVKLEVTATTAPCCRTPSSCSRRPRRSSTTASRSCRTPTTTRSSPASFAQLGCAAVMPLGAPIGSGMGILNPYNLRLIVEQATVPVILDAGIGTASDAALAMELGCDGVLLASSVTRAQDPARMATAMRLAVDAGRLAALAGRIPRRHYAEASSSFEGLPDLEPA